MSLISFIIPRNRANDGKELKVIVNEDFARKVLRVVDAGLIDGVGEPDPGKMCVEAAVSFASGEKHTDGPICVARWLRSWKIRLNDTIGWSNDKIRAKGLRRVAIAQLGTFKNLDTDASRTKFFKLLEAECLKIMKEPFQKATNIKGLAHILRCVDMEIEGFSIHSNDSIKDYLKVTHPAWDEDDCLSAIAEMAVQVLIKMKAPGTKFLYLTEKKKAKKTVKAKHKTKR